MSENRVFLRQVFEKMGAVAGRVTADELNVKPLGPGTMSIASLVVHCCGLTEFWLGHVALSRPSDRDREAEFDAVATHDELTTMLAATIEQADADVAAIEAGGGQPSELRVFLEADGTDAAVILHVFEECYQHLGHMEITADILEHRR